MADMARCSSRSPSSTSSRLRSAATATVTFAWVACGVATLLAVFPLLLAASLISPLARRRTFVLKTVLVLLADYTRKRRQWRRLAASGDLEAAAAVEAETHQRNAELVYKAIIKMEGLWLKVAIDQAQRRGFFFFGGGEGADKRFMIGYG